MFWELLPHNYHSVPQKATFAVTSTNPLGCTLSEETIEWTEPLKYRAVILSNSTWLLISSLPIGRVDVLDLLMIEGRIDFPLWYS